MKSAVETLNPTRVKLTVEVPFEELKPALDSAYRKISQQVRIKGFRPGKVPPRLLDQQVGRGTVLQEAVNDALPQLYGDAVREHELQVIGHPEIEVTEFTDGTQLAFTAEVDVRPEFELPEYVGLPVTVDDAEVPDAEVDEQLDGLRERFAVLTGVERPAASGDYVSLDLAATADGEPIEDASATGLSYEVGSDSLVPGLDEAIIGLPAGESKAFTTTLRDGREAEATVTVRTVKEKELPALDDDFAQTASEFDTIEELRDDVRQRMERIRRLTQGVEARDRVLDALLERVDVPLPEHVLGDEIAYRKQSFASQLEAAGLTKEAYAESEGKAVEELDTEIEEGARQALKSQFVLDAIAAKEELGVTEAELTDQIVRRAQRSGMRAEDYAREVVAQGQLPALMAEVLRGKALALVLEHAKISDRSGREVDLDALTPDVAPETGPELEPEELAAAVGQAEGDPAEAGADSETEAAPAEPAEPAASAPTEG